MDPELTNLIRRDESIFSIEEEHDADLLPELFKEIFSEFGERRDQLVARENVFVFKHGGRWSGYTENDGPSFDRWNSGFKKHSAEVIISHDSILGADFAAIDRFKTSMARALIADFETSIFGTMQEATQGRPAIELKLNEDIKPAVLEMWETIKLGLKDDLTLSQPSIAMDSATFEKFSAKAKELAENDPHFVEQLEEIKLRKWMEALREHFENLLKFQLHDEKRGDIEHQLRQLREIESPQVYESGCDDSERESS